ncbi:MAG: cytidine deaminase [Opitutae bacterium]|nr:cytidine deaminase [Opitutae bacterium]
MSQRVSRPASWQKAIASFPAALRAELDALWETRGVVAPALVDRLCASVGGDLSAAMMRLLPLAQHYAVVPVSHFRVGAVAAGLPAERGASPTLYLGANYEFEGVALSFTVHAEQCATNNAWLHGERGLSLLAVTAAPCGYCRQFLNELSTAVKLAVLLPADTRRGFDATPLAKLLPRSFGPTDLGIKGGLMDPTLSAPTLALAGRATRDAVVASALDAARRSYAPYPTDAAGQFAGVALQFADGTVFTGRYAGNAAYNPSFSPLESALAFAHANSPLGAARRVKRCVLVEVPTLASQRSATEAVLAVAAPRVRLEYFAARVK